MLSVKETGLLVNIVKHCTKINQKINGLTRDQFNSDEDVVQVICFNIMQIGELAKHLSSEFIEQHNGVPWDQIKGMRDKVAHGYDYLDFDRIWFTALNDISPLLDYCNELLTIN